MYKSLSLSFFCLVCSFLTPASVYAESTTVAPQQKKHPRICLALSGGGARGFAHVGVLKVLEEMRIPIDCIAGTSMGAVVGGLYASGLSASEIETRLDALKLNDIALDRVERRFQPQSVREEDEQYPLGATVGLSADGVRLPAGAVQASQFLELLQNWTAHLQPDIEFDKLPIPFRTVATNMETGKMVVFSKGPLHKAIRASMAAPGVFAPIEIDGQLLSDGGLVRNLPVDIARQMGADIIIAVNIGTPLMPREQLQTLFNVSQQMVNILTEQNVEAQKALLGPHDILIEPQMGNISFMDFARSHEAAVIGEKETNFMQQRLRELAVSPEVYAIRHQIRLNPQLPKINIKFVDVVTNGAVPESDIRRQLNIRIGTEYKAEDINSKLAILNTARDFDSINHELVERDGEYGIRVNAYGRNWGPHFLRFGLALSSGFEGAGGFKLQVGHRRPWLTEGGLEWRNDLEFGNSLKLHTELRQPLFEREGMYLSPFAEFGQSTRNVYNGNSRIAEYYFRSDKIGLDLGFKLGEQGILGEAKLGLNFNHYRVRPKLGGILYKDDNGNIISEALPSADLQQFGLKSAIVIDQLSDASFPRYGYKVDASAFVGTSSDRKNFQEVAINSTWANSINNHSINLRLNAAGLFQKGSDSRGLGSTLGGFQQLSAYQPDQFSGNFMLYASATYLLRAVKFDLAGQSLFLGTSLEAGNVWDKSEDITLRVTTQECQPVCRFQ